jgi:membrane-bound inhibitor of C-type lysozyme
MRSRIQTLALVALIAFACSKKEETAAPAVPGEGNEPVSAAPPSAPSEPMKPYTGYDYDCGGVTINAKLDKGNTLVTIDGKTATLSPVSGAAGAQYSGEGFTFTARGDEATLERDGEPPRSCKAKS